MVAICLFRVGSERQFRERLGYDMLFRWFPDREDLGEEPFDPTTFTRHRDRLRTQEVAWRFLTRVVEYARAQNLGSDAHVSVDGTLIEAWASMKNLLLENRTGLEVDPDLAEGAGTAGRDGALRRVLRLPKGDRRRRVTGGADQTYHTKELAEKHG
jgi:hypothetical protein